jgi:hypothetical protein
MILRNNVKIIFKFTPKFLTLTKIIHCCPIKVNKKEATKMASQLKS